MTGDSWFVSRDRSLALPALTVESAIRNPHSAFPLVLRPISHLWQGASQLNCGIGFTTRWVRLANTLFRTFTFFDNPTFHTPLPLLHLDFGHLTFRLLHRFTLHGSLFTRQPAHTTGAEASPTRITCRPIAKLMVAIARFGKPVVRGAASRLVCAQR